MENGLSETAIPFEYRKALALDMYKNDPYLSMKKSGMSDKEINDTYRDWDRAARESNSMGPDYDYTELRSVDGRGHGSDTGKLYRHPTFSNESQYADRSLGLSGGNWDIDANGTGTFTPTKRQIDEGIVNRLQRMVDMGHNDGDIYTDGKGNVLQPKH